ncbi:MAG: N-acyl homoserine lactonase family protein [Pseudolabrys sp.]
MSDDIHEVYAVCYGTHARKRSENYIFGDPHDDMTSIAYYVWVIKGPHGTFVRDTGFDAVAAKERSREITHPVGEGLKVLGVQPDKVDHVIATHMHWDHAGNYDLFPNARYHIQDTEMAYATGAACATRCCAFPSARTMCWRWCGKCLPIVWNSTTALKNWRPVSRCTRLAATRRVCNVCVKTKRGMVVVASDCCHLYSHIDEGRMFPITYSVGDTLEGYKTLKNLASSRHHIVPGHDPEFVKIYPAAKPGLENWVVRLDVKPKA